MKVKEKIPAIDGFEPCINILVKTVEDILPDSIDRLSLNCFVDYYPSQFSRLEVRFYIHIEGRVPALDDYGIGIAKQTLCISYFIEYDNKDLDSYQKYIRGNFGYELRNIVMDIIHFSKTGELLKDEGTGGIKHYSF